MNIEEKILEIIQPTLNQGWESFGSWDEIDKMTNQIISLISDTIKECVGEEDDFPYPKRQEILNKLKDAGLIL